MAKKENNKQDQDLQQDEKVKYDRGSALSIFAGDRHEDFVALLIALVIALGVYVLIN